MASRHLLSIADLSLPELRATLELARQLWLQPGSARGALADQHLLLALFTQSLEARVTLETAARHLGMNVILPSPAELALGLDAHRLAGLSPLVTAFLIGGMPHARLLDAVRGADVPLINAWSTTESPLAVMGDLAALSDRRGGLAGLRICWLGDAAAQAHSLLLAGARLGLHVAVGHPRGYAPDPDIATLARELAGASGGAVLITEDPEEAILDAEAIYTESWARGHEGAELERRRQRFAPYRITAERLAAARPQALLLHGHAARWGEEVEPDLALGPNSLMQAQVAWRRALVMAVLLRRLGPRP
jgi:ornithine carbamoyltransferase